MIGATLNNRNHWKCDFCVHDSYKTMGGIMRHLDEVHPGLVALAKANAEIERLKKMPPKVVEKERIVYRDPPAKPEKKYWTTTVYCKTCQIVITTGIPMGYTIEQTTHNVCGTAELLPVREIR